MSSRSRGKVPEPPRRVLMRIYAERGGYGWREVDKLLRRIRGKKRRSWFFRFLGG